MDLIFDRKSWLRVLGTFFLTPLALACGGDRGSPPRVTDQPILVIGIDGMEWSIMLPMLEAGDLPGFKALMERGSFGELETFEPTFSPVIWTSVATGKLPHKHGITHFVKVEPGQRRPQLNTNRDRTTKALWNIFSDFDQTVHTIGWWMTFPAEEVKGIMVAQTNTPTQIDTRKGRAVWKGTLLPGLKGQVYPPESQDAVIELAARIQENLPQRTRSTFGTFPHPTNELSQRLWNNTQWAFRSDAVYEGIALDLLATGEAFDLMLVYFGGPDVVGHRFWRYMFPEKYRYSPFPEQVENFKNVIRDYYRHMDRVVADLAEAAGPEASVIVLSDHGMQAVNTNAEFHPKDIPDDINSGHHQDAPPGIFIAAGKYITRQTQIDVNGSFSATDLSSVGTVLDIAPTILALKGLPIGKDFDGEVLEKILDAEFLDEFVPQYRNTHDSRAWLASRPDRLLTPEVEKERMEQLRSLGYIQ